MKKKKMKITFAPNKEALSINIKETAERFSLQPSNDWADVVLNPREYRLREYEITRTESESTPKKYLKKL